MMEMAFRRVEVKEPRPSENAVRQKEVYLDTSFLARVVTLLVG